MLYGLGHLKCHSIISIFIENKMKYELSIVFTELSKEENIYQVCYTI